MGLPTPPPQILPPPQPHTIPVPIHPYPFQNPLFKDHNLDDDDETVRLGPRPHEPPPLLRPRPRKGTLPPPPRPALHRRLGGPLRRRGASGAPQRGSRGAEAAAQGASGGVRGGPEGRGTSAAVSGAGDLLQPPAIRGVVEGGGGGVWLPPPGWDHHPLPRLSLRARQDSDRRRPEDLPVPLVLRQTSTSLTLCRIKREKKSYGFFSCRG